MSGGAIKSAVFRAATRAALKKKPEGRLVTMAELTHSAKEELKKEGKNGPVMGMYN